MVMSYNYSSLFIRALLTRSPNFDYNSFKLVIEIIK
jgi:hypothetical protein